MNSSEQSFELLQFLHKTSSRFPVLIFLTFSCTTNIYQSIMVTVLMFFPTTEPTLLAQKTKWMICVGYLKFGRLVMWLISSFGHFIPPRVPNFGFLCPIRDDKTEAWNPWCHDDIWGNEHVIGTDWKFNEFETFDCVVWGFVTNYTSSFFNRSRVIVAFIWGYDNIFANDNHVNIWQSCNSAFEVVQGWSKWRKTRYACGDWLLAYLQISNCNLEQMALCELWRSKRSHCKARNRQNFNGTGKSRNNYPFICFKCSIVWIVEFSFH